MDFFEEEPAYEKRYISIDKRTKAEADAMRKKAAVAPRHYGRKKSMREWAKILGQEEIVTRSGDMMARDGLVVLAQYNRAMKGDTQSAKFLADLLGEMKHDTPIVEQNITLKID